MLRTQEIEEISENKFYTREEVLESTLEYFGGDLLAATVWINKYALKDSEGRIYELNPDDMHVRIAKELFRIESKYNNGLSYETIYDMIKGFKRVVPQGSPMAGIGNNLQLVSLSNCFVIGNEEGDSYGGIMKIDEEAIHLMKRRGGVGNDISFIRPRGSKVNNAAITSTGIVPFMERYSNSTREVAQDGRRGARMITIDIKHPDTEYFIDAKIDKTKVTGANVSVKVSDEFMNCVVNDTTYKQQWPIDSTNPTVIQEINAKELWNKLIKNNKASAEPGILFWTRMINQSLPDCYADLGFKTITTNPCGEIALCDADSCRLLIINLLSHVKEPFTDKAYFDFEMFKESVRVSQRFMDDIIDLELEKIESIISKIELDPQSYEIKRTELNLWKRIKEKCILGRRTGLGITAEGDMIAALGLRFGTSEATAFSELIHKEMCLEAFRTSIELAKERGAFPIYDSEREKNNPYIQRIAQEDPKLYADMVKHGRRNIALLTCAPCGTVSLMTQTSSGIEPVFMVAYTRRRKVNPNDKNVKIDFIDELGDSWEEYNVFHPGFLTWLETKGYDINIVSKMIGESLNTIIEKSPYYKATANDIDWVESVRLQGKVQKWICHSISKTVNLPSTATEELVNNVYMTAWQEGCKGCTVYVDGSRSGVLIDKHEEKLQEKMSLYTEHHAPKRPKHLDCDINRFVNKGEKWIAIVGKMENRPYEIFTGIAEELKIPIYVEIGRIRKTKNENGSKYDLIYIDKEGNEIIIEYLNKKFNEEFWNYSKLISGILRHGMPIPYVVDLISSLSIKDEVITTWKGGVSRTIKKYIQNGTAATDKICKDCGSESVIYQEGCLICKNCGSSKCS